MFFCVFIGILSLRNSLDSRTAKGLGNIETAKKKANSAKKLGIAGIVAGICLITIIRIILAFTLRRR